MAGATAPAFFLGARRRSLRVLRVEPRRGNSAPAMREPLHFRGLVFAAVRLGSSPRGAMNPDNDLVAVGLLLSAGCVSQ